MKKHIFLLIILLCSCKKDIKMMDKRNDCKDCSLVFTDYLGNVVKIDKETYYLNKMNTNPGDIYYNLTFCQFLEFAKSSNSLVECK